MSISMNPEVWTAIWILVAALTGGIVGKVWGPLRRTIAAVDVVAGRPERYPGDEEKRPGLAERFDNIDHAFRDVKAQLTAMRSEIDDVKNHVTNLESECSS
jgi:hypothetical protein